MEHLPGCGPAAGGILAWGARDRPANGGVTPTIEQGALEPLALLFIQIHNGYKIN